MGGAGRASLPRCALDNSSWWLETGDLASSKLWSYPADRISRLSINRNLPVAYSTVCCWSWVFWEIENKSDSSLVLSPACHPPPCTHPQS